MCTSCASTSEPRVAVIAHRGYSGVAPENTLSSFRRAVAVGANYVELDARASADGTLYVMHDKTLDRTTNAKAVLGKAKVPFGQWHDADIEKLDAGSWFGEKFTGERVPTLAAALDVIQAKSRTLLEHKDGSAEAYARLLREKGLIGKLIVQSFDWDFLAALHKLEPRQPLAALGEKQMDTKKWTKLQTTGARTIAWNYPDLSAALVERLHQGGYKVYAWTPDKPEEWDRMIEYGVEGIITNQPEALVAYLREKAPKSEE